MGTNAPADGSIRFLAPPSRVRGRVVAIVLATILATAFHTGHAGVYAVLMVSSSALALPVIQSLKLDDQNALDVTAQIAIADAVCIVLLPLVINRFEPSRRPSAPESSQPVRWRFSRRLRAVDRRGMRRRCTHYSPRHRFALGCESSLIVLFSFAALAVAGHVSIMLAGFALGLVVSAVGEPGGWPVSCSA